MFCTVLALLFCSTTPPQVSALEWFVALPDNQAALHVAVPLLSQAQRCAWGGPCGPRTAYQQQQPMQLPFCAERIQLRSFPGSFGSHASWPSPLGLCAAGYQGEALAMYTCIVDIRALKHSRPPGLQVACTRPPAHSP
jgi:hypothetical protein